jgi:hypothetical protein
MARRGRNARTLQRRRHHRCARSWRHGILQPAEFAKGATVTRSNILYLIIGALVVGAAVMGYQLYQDRKQPEGMRIDLGPNGISIEKK